MDKMDQAEAVYYAALATLDELETIEERMSVVMNWVKYIALRQAKENTPKGDSLLPAFNGLCLSFAYAVIELPAMYASQFDGKDFHCAHCEADATKPPRETLQ